MTTGLGNDGAVPAGNFSPPRKRCKLQQFRVRNHTAGGMARLTDSLYMSRLLPIASGIHNVVYVVTEKRHLHAFDADTGVQLWSQSVLNGEQPSDDRGCGQVSPQIGITSTPVIDLSSGPNGTIYLAAMMLDNSGNYHQRLHVIDLVTHTEEFGGPIEAQATFPKTSGVTTFDPKQYKERAALLLLNGVIYTSWASHGHINPDSA